MTEEDAEAYPAPPTLNATRLSMAKTLDRACPVLAANYPCLGPTTQSCSPRHALLGASVTYTRTNDVQVADAHVNKQY